MASLCAKIILADQNPDLGLQPVELGVEASVVPAILDQAAGVRDSGAVTTEELADFGEAAPQHHIHQVHGKLAGGRHPGPTPRPVQQQGQGHLLVPGDQRQQRGRIGIALAPDLPRNRLEPDYAIPLAPNTPAPYRHRLPSMTIGYYSYTIGKRKGGGDKWNKRRRFGKNSKPGLRGPTGQASPPGAGPRHRFPSPKKRTATWRVAAYSLYWRLEC